MAEDAIFRTGSKGSFSDLIYWTVDTPTSWHIYKVTWKAGEGRGYQNDTLKATSTSYVPTTDLHVHFREGNAVGRDAYVDYVFLRKWVDPEPTHGVWGKEEKR